MNNNEKSLPRGWKRQLSRWKNEAKALGRDASPYTNALRQQAIGFFPQHLDIVPNEVKGATAWWARKGM